MEVDSVHVDISQELVRGFFHVTEERRMAKFDGEVAMIGHLPEKRSEGIEERGTERRGEADEEGPEAVGERLEKLDERECLVFHIDEFSFVCDAFRKLETEFKSLGRLVRPPCDGLRLGGCVEGRIALDTVENAGVVVEEVCRTGSWCVELAEPEFVGPHWAAEMVATNHIIEDRVIED